MTGEQRDRVPGCTALRLIFPEQGRSIFLGAGGGAPSLGRGIFPGEGHPLGEDSLV